MTPVGRTLEQAAAEEQARLVAAAAARWDPWLELLLPVGIAAISLALVAVVAGLLAVMLP